MTAKENRIKFLEERVEALEKELEKCKSNQEMLLKLS